MRIMTLVMMLVARNNWSGGPTKRRREMEDTMRTIMIVLLLGGVCAALIAFVALMDNWEEAEKNDQQDWIDLDNITLAEARKEK